MAGLTGGIKMYRKADLPPETIVFDMVLLDLFERWRHNAIQHCDDIKLEHANWLEDFCSYVWKSLEDFEETGRLKEPLRPQ